MSHHRGFTVIELLVVIAIIGLLLMAFPVAITSFQESRQIGTAIQATVQSARRAQALSRATASDASWGVSVQTGSVILFQGASYATRDAAFDEVLEFSDAVQVTGITEIVFDKLTGEPDVTGTIDFETDVSIRTLIMYETGALQYE